MHEAAIVIEAISQTSSYNDKMAILQRYASTPGLKEILRFIYNPYVKTGVGARKLEKAIEIAKAHGSSAVVDYHSVLSWFTTHQTGSDTDLMYAGAFVASQPDNATRELAKAIVTQDLKIGVTSTTLNKVYGSSFIPKVGCILGKKYNDVAHKIKWPCIVTEKLDGVRRVLIKENGVVAFYSRSGHIDTGLLEIEREAAYLPDNMVYDGELLAKGNFADSIALRQATNSISNSKGVKTGLTFNMFDMLPVDQFYAGKSHWNALSRKSYLAALLGDYSLDHLTSYSGQLINEHFLHIDFQHIKTVPILGYVKCLAEVEPIAEAIWAAGGEGVMLNTASGLYEIKRSSELIKLKRVLEYSLPVIDMEEGEGKFSGMLGALVVDYKGQRVGVGSGFTDQQRRQIWAQPSRHIGRTIEIDSFGESTNVTGSISLNCPIFKRFKGCD